MQVEFVPAARVHALFGEVVTPERLGFTKIRQGLHAKIVDADIAHVLRFIAYKGYSYGFTWGVSLACMPHDWGHQVRFHRTLKSARLDLWESAHEEQERERGTEQDGFVPALYGEAEYRRQLTNAWDFACSRATRWWASASTLDGVLEHAIEQVRRPSVSTDSIHWPRPALVVPFVLARLGAPEDARSHLDELLVGHTDWWLEHRERDNIRTALERVIRETQHAET